MMNTILSIIAILVSIGALLITFFQNKQLHKDNKSLSVLPIISQDIMIWSLIRCRVEKRKDAIDELNVLVSPYDQFYNNNDIVISQSNNPLLTVLTKNSGNGIGENICIKEILIFTENDTIEYKYETVLFSLPANETIATRIYANIDENAVKEVLITIKYNDIFGKTYLLSSRFAIQGNLKAEMKLINSFRKCE